MSDIHVLTGDGNQKWNIVIHIEVPDANNSAIPGVNWRAALINSGLGGNTNLPDGDGSDGTIDSTEKAKVVSGELYEHLFFIEVEGIGSDTTKRTAALRAAYSNEKAVTITKIQRQLKFYGQTLSET